MIPQIQAIQDATDDEKVRLVEAGLALIAPGGKLFLSLEAVNILGLKVMEQDPGVMVGMECAEQGVVATEVIASGDQANTTIHNLVERLYGVISYSAKQGIPLYEALRYYMQHEHEARSVKLDYTNVILTAASNLKALRKAKAAQAAQAVSDSQQ